MLGHRRPPGLLKERRCKAPPRLGLRSPGKISRHGEPLCSRWEFSLKRRGRERERERELTRGEPDFREIVFSFIFQKNFYTLSCTQRSMDNTKSCRVSSPDPYRDQAFFCIPFPQTMLCILSSGLGGLWTFSDPLQIKDAQPENLFSLEVFFLYISNLRQPQKVSNRVTFSRSKGAASYNKERTNQLKGLMWLVSRLHLFFLHSNYVN